MSNAFKDRRGMILEARLSQLNDEYEAVQIQLGYILSEANKLRLKRQSDQIESEIQELEQEILHLNSRENVAKAEPNMNNLLKVFLCHASENKLAAIELYDWLESASASPWLDKKKLLPGQDWELEIRRAVRASDVVLVLSSQKSVTKAGYVQKEIKIALDEADKQPEGAIYIIPVRLEACQPPDRLSHVQWVDLYESDGHETLLASLQSRAKELGRTLPSLRTPSVPVVAPKDTLGDNLKIGLGRGGLHPHKSGPGQWWVRLKIESKTNLRNCQGQLYDILRLENPEDPGGVPLPEAQASILSWADGVFEPVDIKPGDVPRYLDLAWRAAGDPPMPDDELRIASAKDQGKRDTSSKQWGLRQDFIPLKPGFYRLIIRIVADGYLPIERAFRLHWPRPGCEDDIRLSEDAVRHEIAPDQLAPKPTANPEVQVVLNLQITLKLMTIFETWFSIDELRDLCLHLSIDFEDLPQNGSKANVSRELALYLVRRDRVEESISIIKELRPNIEWDRGWADLINLL